MFPETIYCICRLNSDQEKLGRYFSDISNNKKQSEWIEIIKCATLSWKETANHCWRKVDLRRYMSCWLIGRLNRQYCPNDVLLYSRSLEIQWNLIKILKLFLGRADKLFQKFIWKWKGLREGNKLEKWQP